MNILSIVPFGSATWDLIQSIYEFRWNHITVNNKKCLFQQCVLNQFNNGPHLSSSCPLTNKPAEISITSPLISLKPSKETLAKSKFFKKYNIAKKLYSQVSKSNINNIIKIKNTFPKLPTKKIVKVNNIVNKSGLVKLKKKMTIKGPLRNK